MSITTDPYGRVLASMDYAKASDRVMVAQVPIQGTQTVFAAAGDWFGWLMVIGFVGMAGWAIVRRPKATSTTEVQDPSTKTDR